MQRVLVPSHPPLIPKPGAIIVKFYNFLVEATHVRYVKLVRRLPEKIALEQVSEQEMAASRPHALQTTSLETLDEWPGQSGDVVYTGSVPGNPPFELRLAVDHRSDGTVLLGMSLASAGASAVLLSAPAFRVRSVQLRLGNLLQGEIYLRGDSQPCAAECCTNCFHHQRIFFDLKVPLMREFEREPCSSVGIIDLVWGFAYRGTRGPFVEITDLRTGAEYSAWLAYPTEAVSDRCCGVSQNMHS